MDLKLEYTSSKGWRIFNKDIGKYITNYMSYKNAEKVYYNINPPKKIINENKTLLDYFSIKTT